MRKWKFATACLVTTLTVVGCSRMSETRPVSDEEVILETAASAAPASASPVEMAASTKPPTVAEQRPIVLPRYTPDFATTDDTIITYQSFEIGNQTTSIDVPDVHHVTSRQHFTYETGPTRYAPSYPQRPVPSQGMTMNEVLAAAGEPANRMNGNGSAVWDYGTYRVFFQQDQVAFTRVW